MKNLNFSVKKAAYIVIFLTSAEKTHYARSVKRIGFFTHEIGT